MPQENFLKQPNGRMKMTFNKIENLLKLFAQEPNAHEAEVIQTFFYYNPSLVKNLTNESREAFDEACSYGV